MAKDIMNYLLWQGYGFPQKDGIDTVSESVIARVLRSARSTVSKAMSELAERHWITKKPQGFRKQNVYHINNSIKEWVILDNLTIVEMINSGETNSEMINSGETNSEMTNSEIVKETIRLLSTPLVLKRSHH